ncbi:hypothetical protein LCGC14_0142700 [marine sediment metagenome]|uniref:Uncharacterized protein n=1 Tax=marine sediment metagenome TaxID=412755 RepID=A0A0F9V1A5_9ZZZZ
MTAIIKVEHGQFGLGEIGEINFDEEGAIISVEWDDGLKGRYRADEIEFVVTNSNETK